MEQELIRQLRKYEGLWEEIKKKRSCSIKPADNSVGLFNRIKAAVIKEKCNDIAFKFGLDDKSSKLEIERSKNGNIITFKLKVGVGVEDI